MLVVDEAGIGLDARFVDQREHFSPTFGWDILLLDHYFDDEPVRILGVQRVERAANELIESIFGALEGYLGRVELLWIDAEREVVDVPRSRYGRVGRSSQSTD